MLYDKHLFIDALKNDGEKAQQELELRMIKKAVDEVCKQA